jgi:hypothetical protein
MFIADTFICNCRKWHAMVGNLAGIWLTGILEDALKELVAKEPDPLLLEQLRALELADHKAFMSKELPSILKDLELPDDVDPEVFYRGANFCHIARLPAETRYLGILTESSLVGEDNYDKGLDDEASKHKYDQGENEDTAVEGIDKTMQLTYKLDTRQVCPIPVNKDYKDYFYLYSTHSWSQLTLPNDAEMKAYGTGEPLRGVIAVCFVGCDWGNCPGGNIRRDEINEGLAEMEVNGVKVSNLTKFDDCEFLKHEGGHVWKPNSDGRFKIRAKVNAIHSYIRISSIVVW